MRPTALLALTLLLLGAAAHAQDSSRPQPHSFRTEWARLPPTFRPGVEGYVYNDSRWRVTNVVLRAQVVDGSGRVVRESFASVWGNVVPGGRAFFKLSPIADGESYELSVVSFDLIAQEGP
jgi:hypothetical protein